MEFMEKHMESLTPQDVDRAWTRAYASNAVYDQLADVLPSDLLEEERLVLTAEELLGNKAIEGVMNVRVGYYRDMFKQLVSEPDHYAHLPDSPFDVKYYSEQSQPEQAQVIELPRPAKPAATNKRGMMATGKPITEVEAHTQQLIENMRLYFESGDKDNSETVAYLNKTTEFYIQKGGKEYMAEVRNGEIVTLGDKLQLLLWVGQANGPFYAATVNTPDKRLQLIHSMINKGKLDEEAVIKLDALENMLAKAAEEDLLEDTTADGPKLTENGMDYILKSKIEDTQAAKARRKKKGTFVKY